MLLQVTWLVDLSGMAATLWMGFYLLGRGFPSRITLRAVIVLLLLSYFFFDAYNNLFQQVSGTAAVRAAVIVFGLGAWYSLTFHLMPAYRRKPLRWMAVGLYVLCGAAAASMLWARNDLFIGESANLLYVAHMRMGLAYVLFGIFLVLISVGILSNLLTGERIGLSTQGRYFLLASVFPVLAVLYGVLGFAGRPPLPRFPLDLLILSGVTLLAISVARHQSLVERRTSLQDFPISGLTVLGLAVLYALLGRTWGLPPDLTAAVMAFAILTHAFYDLVREFLERSRIRNESGFRRQLRQLENGGFDETAVQRRLQEGLDLLCESLRASGGFIAVRRDQEFAVVATRQSISLGSQLPARVVACDDVVRSDREQLPGVAWIAPAFEADAQVAVVGIGPPRAKFDYSTGDLDLLAEVVDRVGTLTAVGRLQPQKVDQIEQLIRETEAGASELHLSAEEMIATITHNPDPEFIKMVEEGLRHLSDYMALGNSPLADWAGVTGESHVERGKNLQGIMLAAIEALRPAGARPGEPLPREWYSYAVLYDAYVEGALNREIMARLYISEGTFNRTRRNAIRGLARLLMEKHKTART